MLISKLKRLVLLRHAESFANAIKGGRVHVDTEEELRALCRWSDEKVPLTPAGIIQAQQAGIGLAARYGYFDCAYHTGYERSRQTLAEILKQFPWWHTEVREEIRFRERESGYGHYMTRATYEARYPEMKAYWDLVGPFFSVPPGGESVAGLREARTLPALQELLGDPSLCNKSIIIVLHGRSMTAVKYDLDIWNPQQASNFMQYDNPKNCEGFLYERSSQSNILELIGPAL